jgi:hypothetical protein
VIGEVNAIEPLVSGSLQPPLNLIAANRELSCNRRLRLAVPNRTDDLFSSVLFETFLPISPCLATSFFSHSANFSMKKVPANADSQGAC